MTPSPGKKKARILVVEDDPSTLILMLRMLEDRGHHAVVATDGREALLFADSSLDLILLDLMMPGMDGGELLQELRGRADTRQIPVIICSAIHTSHSAVDRARAFGVVDYFVKGRDEYPRLMERIDALLAVRAQTPALAQPGA